MNIVKQSSAGSAAYKSMCAPTQGRGLSLVNIVRQSSVGSAAYERMCAPTQGRGLSLVSIVKQSSERPATYDDVRIHAGKTLSSECSFRLIFTFEF